MTNNQLTKEWLQQTIAELESVRDEIPFGIDTNSELELAAFKLALAAMDSEPVAYTDERNLSYIDRGRETAYLWGKQNSEASDVALYRHAQPAPVVLKDHQMRELVNQLRDTAIQYHGTQQLREQIARVIRAATLQAEPVTTANKLGNSPVIPEGYVMVPKEPTDEMQSAGASAIRIETTALNKLWTGNAVFRAMLAAAPQEVKP